MLQLITSTLHALLCIFSVWDHLVQVISIFCDTCEAVARLHHCQTPIIHRDLKVTRYLSFHNMYDWCDRWRTCFSQTRVTMSSVILDLPLQECSSQRYILVFVPDTNCDVSGVWGTGHRWGDQEVYNLVLQVSLLQKYFSQSQKRDRFLFRSPEMVDLYSGLHITTKADIWALGCLLYKVLGKHEE